MLGQVNAKTIITSTFADTMENSQQAITFTRPLTPGALQPTDGRPIRQPACTQCQRRRIKVYYLFF